MGILSGTEIIKAVALGDIQIEPFNLEQVNPNSYNVRLSDIVKTFSEVKLDVKRKPRETIINLNSENGLEMLPGVGYLGSTIEKVGSKKYVPIINGRSTLGRYFLTVHQTAGFGDVGFYGNWTLEMVAMFLPIKIYPGIEIAQICFEELVGNNNHQYKGRYVNQDQPKGPEPL